MIMELTTWRTAMKGQIEVKLSFTMGLLKSLV